MLKLVVILVAAVLGIVAIFAIGSLALFYFEGYDYSTPLLNKTVVIANYTEGIRLERNPGFVDTNGDGYLLMGLGMYVYYGEKYKIKYFCGKNDNLRKVVYAEWIAPEPTLTLVPPEPTPDPFFCRNIGGVCE